MPAKPEPRPSPWKDVPRRSILVFFAAVFLTFATMGVVSDFSGMGREPVIRYVAGVLVSGGFAVMYAWLGIHLRGRFLLPFIPLVAVQIGWMILFANLFPDGSHSDHFNMADTDVLSRRLGFDAVAVTLTVSLSYAGFLTVFIGESRRHIRANAEKAVLEAARPVQQLIVPDNSETVPGYRTAPVSS